MHAHAAESLSDGGERTHDLAVTGAAHLVERPGAVLAARTGDERLRPHRQRRPSSRTTASAARSPDSQAPPTVPQSVSCAASPAKKMRLLSGSIRILRDGCPPGDAAEKAPSMFGSSFHRVAWVRRTTLLTSAPNKPVSHSIDRKSTRLNSSHVKISYA